MRYMIILHICRYIPISIYKYMYIYCIYVHIFLTYMYICDYTYICMIIYIMTSDKWNMEGEILKT